MSIICIIICLDKLYCTVLPAKSDGDALLCLLNNDRLIIDRSLARIGLIHK